jgi:hypothetical protein
MELKELKEGFYSSTIQLSEINRNLILAGVGLVWALRVGGIKNGDVAFTPDMAGPLVWMMFSFALDLVQYLFRGTACYVRYERLRREGHKDDAKIEMPDWIVSVTFGLFYGKIIIGGTAFLMLAYEIGRQLLF